MYTHTQTHRHTQTHTKDVFFNMGNRLQKQEVQEIPRVPGKFELRVQSEAGQRLTEFCQENALVIANTLFQQHKRRLYTWTLTDGQYQNQIDYFLFSQTWRRSIQSAKTRQGAVYVKAVYCHPAYLTYMQLTYI